MTEVAKVWSVMVWHLDSDDVTMSMKNLVDISCTTPFQLHLSDLFRSFCTKRRFECVVVDVVADDDDTKQRRRKMEEKPNGDIFYGFDAVFGSEQAAVQETDMACLVSTSPLSICFKSLKFDTNPKSSMFSYYFNPVLIYLKVFCFA